MQTDTWLTDTFYPDRCPLCNRPLPSGSNTCSACGFTAHEPASNAPSGARPSTSRPSHPITPIPARASARRFQSQPGIVPRRRQATRLVSESPASAGPELPPKDGNWHHESSRYEAASSLSSLSLIISETPTAPPRSPRSTGQLEHIDEIDTVPESSGRMRAVEKGSGRTRAVSPASPEAASASGPLSLRFDDLEVPTSAVVLSDAVPPVPFSHIDEIDTVPEPGSTPSKALVPQQSATHEIAVDAASWTTGPGSTSSLAASFIASHSPRRGRRTRKFNPLDRTRWWLLRPGHMEFLLWSAGSMLLFGVTFLILLATVLSVMLPGFRVSGNLPISTVNASAPSS